MRTPHAQPLTLWSALAALAVSMATLSVSHAEPAIVPLSPEAMFQRCYGQLVRTRAPKNHPLLQQVKSGTVSAIDACMQILSKGDFAAQTGSAYSLTNPADPESRAVLKTMHNLHRSWLIEPAYPDKIYANIDHHYDTESAVGFFTHALFGPNVPYRSIVTETRDLRILRDEPYRVVNLNAPFQWADSADIQQGEIRGVEFFPEGSTSWKTKVLQSGGGGIEQTSVTMRYGPYTTFQSKRSFGGGMLGLASFIWGHIGYPEMRDQANGAERVPRRWAVHLYSGLLCRDMPFLRQGDVSQMVAEYIQQYPDQASQIPFRANTQCMACHGAQDPLAAAIRNVTFVETDLNAGTPDEERQRHILLGGGVATLPTEQAGFHLIAPNANFYRTPPNFKLYYRSYDGSLINESYSANSIESALSQLGQALTTKDDLYMCVASRYFSFFTGIQVNLRDYADPAAEGVITDGDMHYRQMVKSLAMGLKNDPAQSVKSVIRKIFELPLYQTEGLRDPKP